MPGGRATNLYSPCPPVTMERSSFDSLLEIATLAPLIALPLGSVTVPCRELDEICATAMLAITTICTIVKIAHRRTNFMCGPPAWNLPSDQAERSARGRMFGLRAGVFLTPQGSTGGRPAAQQNTPKPDSWLVYK